MYFTFRSLPNWLQNCHFSYEAAPVLSLEATLRVGSEDESRATSPDNFQFWMWQWTKVECPWSCDMVWTSHRVVRAQLSGQASYTTHTWVKCLRRVFIKPKWRSIQIRESVRNVEKGVIAKAIHLSDLTQDCLELSSIHLWFLTVAPFQRLRPFSWKRKEVVVPLWYPNFY